MTHLDCLPTADADLVDADSALRILRVKRQTLYAYVSRGMVRAFRVGASASSLYAKDDLEAIASRSRKKREGPAPGERSMRPGGAAVLRTNISFISAQGPVYRGVRALDMARAGWHFEACASHLWNAGGSATHSAWHDAQVTRFVSETMPALQTACGKATMPHTQRLVLAAFNAATRTAGPSAEDADGLMTARRIVMILAAALRPPGPAARPGERLRLAAQIGACSRVPRSAEAHRAIDAALILSADHELAPATFVARIAASAGTDLGACALAALGAFEGHSSLLGCDAFEARLLEAPSAIAYVEALSATLEQRMPLAGYKHPAYPQGDPRAHYLIALARTHAHGHPRAEALLHCVDEAETRLGLAPSIIAALVLLSHALGLPTGAAACLMSTGRSAGWIAHCIEQRQRGYKLRPHAAYTG